MANRQLDFTGFIRNDDPRVQPQSTYEPPALPESLNLNQETPQSGFDFAAMIKQLKQAQAFGYQQENQAQDEQFRRGTAPLPSDLANKQLSPNQIRGFRSGEVNTINPTLGGARGLVQEAKSAITEYQQSQDKITANAEKVLSKILETTDLVSLKNLDPKYLAKLETDAGYPKGFIQAAVTYKSKNVGLGTESDKDLRDLNDSQTRLLATRGNDGFIDPQAYLSERAKSRLSPSDFDSRLSHLLSPQEKQRLLGTSKNEELTVDQSKARGFARTARQADTNLASSGFSPNFFQINLPSRVQSESRQQFEQAARAFVNSVLRRESGAQITDAEFLNKYKELIPAPGDSEAVKKQKAQARLTQITSLEEAGILSPGGGEVRNVQGVNYVKGSDGLWHKQ